MRKSYSIRIEPNTLEKIRYISNYEGRSLNSQLAILMRDCIQAFENEHGEIIVRNDVRQTKE